MTITAGIWDGLLASQKGYDVAISFIPLPYDAQDTTFWKHKEASRPKIIDTSGQVAGLPQYLELSWLYGAVVRSQEVDGAISACYRAKAIDAEDVGK